MGEFVEIDEATKKVKALHRESDVLIKDMSRIVSQIRKNNLKQPLRNRPYQND